MTTGTCDWWAAGAYCSDAPVRRYMNGWRCIKHTPAAIRSISGLSPWNPGHTFSLIFTAKEGQDQ